MILLIDNYDSFTYNLAHLFGELGADVVVRRNDAIDADGAERLEPRISSSPPVPAARPTPARRSRSSAASLRKSPHSVSASVTRRWPRPSAARSARRASSCMERPRRWSTTDAASSPASPIR